MSKQSLNLSVEESIKERAKRIAREKGISVSQFFEQLIVAQKDPKEFTPTPGSVAHKLMNLAAESEKKEYDDYDELRYQSLKEKYDLE